MGRRKPLFPFTPTGKDAQHFAERLERRIIDHKAAPVTIKVSVPPSLWPELCDLADARDICIADLFRMLIQETITLLAPKTARSIQDPEHRRTYDLMISCLQKRRRMNLEPGYWHYELRLKPSLHQRFKDVTNAHHSKMSVTLMVVADFVLSGLWS
jgi:hypothetical protein